ncbi:S1 family peptidase [Tahibacter amnicola]|uniref:S1 family peptidase n=1 Tax=Tahibacter amnicola TaxID=2976241 RepID=A0ABY6B7S5_9GAMM|nr:S1 family peptidase [Tahibacter amnicola]UXI65939.1 S1 family peptidase [Tahibacter amnicola]
MEAAKQQLDDIVQTQRVSGKPAALDPSLHSWYVDVRLNRLVVDVEAGAHKRAIDLIASTRVDAHLIQFTESKHRPQLTFDVRGGDGYRIGTQHICSIGFAVRQDQYNGFLTAGHCGGVGASTTTWQRESIGDVYASVFPTSDYGVVHNANPQGIPRPWVNAYSFGGNLTIVGATPAVVGAPICRSGVVSGARCGTLTATNVTVQYAEGLVFGLSTTSACVAAGDSGGSVVTPTGHAQGVNSGGYLPNGTHNCDQQTPLTFFQPILPILEAFPRMTLVTGP